MKIRPKTFESAYQLSLDGYALIEGGDYCGVGECCGNYILWQPTQEDDIYWDDNNTEVWQEDKDWYFKKG